VIEFYQQWLAQAMESAKQEINEEVQKSILPSDL